MTKTEAFTAVVVAGLICGTLLMVFRQQAEVRVREQQAQLERTRTEQATKLQRTKERMEWNPWYSKKGEQ